MGSRLGEMEGAVADLAPPIELSNWHPTAQPTSDLAIRTQDTAPGLLIGEQKEEQFEKQPERSVHSSPSIPKRQSSLAKRPVVALDDISAEKADQAARSGAAAGARLPLHRQQTESADQSAGQGGLLLNLPPPPPFALKVDGLTIGLPPPKSIS